MSCQRLFYQTLSNINRKYLELNIILILAVLCYSFVKGVFVNLVKIGFVGAGRLGSSFGLFLSRKGNNVTGYYSRTYTHAMQAASLIGEHCHPYFHIGEVISSSEWVVITTSDDAIGRVAAQIFELGMDLSGKTIFHMSGASTSCVLSSLQELGAEIASLHPLQTFADPVTGAQGLENAYFSIEGTPMGVFILQQELQRMNLRYFIINAEQKPLYHAAASIASNSLVAVIDYSLTLLEQVGIERKQGVAALYPLIEASMKNCREKGPEKALTGPIVRGDIGTVELHMDKIRQEAPELLQSYRDLSQLTFNTAVKNQLKDEYKIEKIKKLLFP